MHQVGGQTARLEIKGNQLHCVLPTASIIVMLL